MDDVYGLVVGFFGIGVVVIEFVEVGGCVVF